MSVDIQESGFDNELSGHTAEDEVINIIERLEEAQYFDATSMAPLTPTALVSPQDR